MNPWLRWYAGTCEDVKFRIVASNADVTQATVTGVWACLLEDASHVTHRGIALRGMDYWTEVTGLHEAELGRILEGMKGVGLITEDNGKYLIVQWKIRQFESDVKDPTNAQRQRRYRERHKAPFNNGGVTHE